MSDPHSSASLSPETPTETVGPLADGDGGSSLAAGEVLGNRFRIESRLGSGSFGIVYRARDLRLDQDVAIKLFRSGRFDARSFERVKREVRLAREARGEGLVRIFDLETSGDRCFLVMELVQGGTLRELFRREAPLGFERVRELAREILQCLAQLHRQDVLHRDIKPANILIDSRGQLRLADFGLARSLAGDSRLTATGRTVGSAAYLAPESGEAADVRSDLYSFGVVLFEMLAGRLPFESADPLEQIKAHLRSEAPDLRQLVPGVPPELADLVSRLLAKSPADRPASAEETLALLDGGAPVSGSNASARASLRDPGRLGKRLALAGFAALLLWGGWRFGPSAPIEAPIEPREAIEAPQSPEPMAAGQSGAIEPGASPAGSGLDSCQMVDVEPNKSLIEMRYQGEVLWQLSDAVGAQQLDLRDGRRVIVAVFDHARNSETQRWRIEVRDCFTRDLLTERFYRSFHEAFASTGFSDTYTVEILLEQREDRDYLWLSFRHQPYWPTHIAVLDLEDSHVKGVFYNSGHGRFLGRRDIDGDGVEEALFSGTNNRLGYQPFIAAMYFDNRNGTPLSFSSAYSPDSQRNRFDNGLVWYTLMPKTVTNTNPHSQYFEQGLLAFPDEALGAERLYRLDGTEASEAMTPTEVAERWRAQGRAYASYRVAETQLRRSKAADALAAFRKARREAEAARDGQLGWWLDVRIGETLIRLGRAAEGNAHFDRLSKTLEEGQPGIVETFFQWACALHLTGHSAASIEPYSRALELSGLRTGFIRRPWEITENMILAQVALGRTRQALETLEAYIALHPTTKSTVDPYRAFVTWRSGGRLSPIRIRPGTTDLPLYWHHEFRWQTEGASEALVDAVRGAAERSSESKGMLWALEAVVLRELGKPAEAMAACREAMAWLELWRREMVPAYGHADIIEQRCDPARADS